MFKFITIKLEEEYHHLSLWYFVSFFYGIIFYFKTLFYLNYVNKVVLTTTAAILLLLLVVFFTKREKLLLTFCSSILLFFILGISVSFFRIANTDTKVLEKPDIFDIRAKTEEIKPTTNGIQLVLTVLEARNHSQINHLNKIRINLKTDAINELKKDDIIKLPVQLFPLRGPLLPGGYDFGLYLYLNGIQATGYGLKKPEIITPDIEKESYLHNFYLKLQNIRNIIYDTLIKVLGTNDGNFAAAILIGETKAINPEMATNMRSSGIAHILSVSGLHLSLVAIIFFTTIRFLLNCSNYLSYKINIKAVSGVISILGSFGYLLLSGSNIAATRAFIMTLLVIIAIIFERSAYPLRSVMLAGMFILVFSPEYIMHPSFQLSFSAVLCLISGYEIYIRNQKVFGHSSGILGSIKFYLFNNIYSSFLASFITAPFVIYHFYKFATYSVLMNLIAVPIMSFFMMPLAIFSLVIMPFSTSASSMILKLLGFFIKIVTSSAAYVVSMPNSTINTGYITDLSMLVYSFGFFWICLWQTKLRYLGIVIMLISLIMMYFTPKPDFIYDHRIKAIAIKNNDSLDIYAKNKISNFTKEYWLNWYGITKVNIFEQEVDFRDQLFEISIFKNYNSDLKQPTILLNHKDKNCYSRIEVQIIISSKLVCPKSAHIIDYDSLVKSGIVLGFCQKSGCITKLGLEPVWRLNHD